MDFSVNGNFDVTMWYSELFDWFKIRSLGYVIPDIPKEELIMVFVVFVQPYIINVLV